MPRPTLSTAKAKGRVQGAAVGVFGSAAVYLAYTEMRIAKLRDEIRELERSFVNTSDTINQWIVDGYGSNKTDERARFIKLVKKQGELESMTKLRRKLKSDAKKSSSKMQTD